MATLANKTIGLGQRPALLIIDATIGFCDPSSPLGVDGGSALEKIADLLHVFRRLNLPVFFTVNAYASVEEASVFREKLPGLDLLVAGGKLAEIHSSVKPLPSEAVIRKTVPSGFFDSPLRQMLSAENVDSVVVCGFSTSGCVRATAVDALQCNLRVVVAADACGDRDSEAHVYNLRDLGLKTGDVVNTVEALGMLDKFALSGREI